MNSRLNKSSEKEGPEATGGPPLESTTGEFPSGAIGWSPRAIKLHDKIDFGFYLRRHLRGDDGDVSEGQHLKNFFAWRNGLRVWSVYNTPESPDGKIWIVTEADRSATYIMLPSDYPACMMPPEAAMSKIAEECRQTWVFPPGRIRISPRASYLYNKIDIGFYLRRHLLGDDGDVSEDQHQKNLLAQRDGLRIWSVYNTPESPDGKIWIITEADRSVTRIMLPSEYDAPDPYDATKCDMCGQHKETVRQRRVITIGLVSRTVRTKFCDECAATVRKWSQTERLYGQQRNPRARVRGLSLQALPVIALFRAMIKKITFIAVPAIVGFVFGYSLRAPKADIAATGPPEIRRAIPVEQEIRKAILVEPEIRKAIPVQTKERRHYRSHPRKH